MEIHLNHGIQKPHVGVSNCLLGIPIRYDGHHKLDSYLKRYSFLFMEALESPATKDQHTKALSDIAEILKLGLTKAELRILLEEIERFKEEESPVVVPIIKFKKQLANQSKPHLKDQWYFDLKLYL